MAAMFTVNDALGAYRWHIALKAEILDFFLRVITARITQLSEWLTDRLWYCGCICPCFVNLLRLIWVSRETWLHLSVCNCLDRDLRLLLNLLFFNHRVVDFEQLCGTLRIEHCRWFAEFTQYRLDAFNELGGLEFDLPGKCSDFAVGIGFWRHKVDTDYDHKSKWGRLLALNRISRSWHRLHPNHRPGLNSYPTQPIPVRTSGPAYLCAGCSSSFRQRCWFQIQIIYLIHNG